MTFQVLPVGVLQNILQLTVGPQEERYVGGGRSATVLPVVLDTDSHGLCKLRLVCKAFRDAARAIPVFVSASTPRQIGSLATTFFQGWDIAAVQLNLSAQAPHDMVAAACALPDRERSKIVSVSVPGGSVAQLAAGLGQLEGLQHVVIHGTFTNPYCLPHIERLELRDMQSCTPEMLAWMPTSHNLHTLHLTGGSELEIELPFDAVAGCPALRCLELGSRHVLTSSGTIKQAQRALEKSSLQVLSLQFMAACHRTVWRAQASSVLTVADILLSVRFDKCFSITASAPPGEARCLVLRRRCAKESLMQRIADCKGGSLVLNGDLSLQLVLSAELQALVRDAGLPVQLLLDIEKPLPDVSVKHWALFNVPVHSVSWSPYFAHAWYIMEFFARAGQEVAAITTLCIPPEAGAGAPGFAAAFPNVRSISLLAEGGIPGALPKSCERVGIIWTGQASMGRTAGFGAFPHMKRLFLQGFRVTELPPRVADLDLLGCAVEGAAVPAGRQLESLTLDGCNPEREGAAFYAQERARAHAGPSARQRRSGRALLDLLAWLGAALPQAAVKVVDARLALGPLSMQDYAQALSEVAPASVSLEACTLHARDGSLSAHSVADLARHMAGRFGGSLAVTCPASSEGSCTLVRVGSEVL